MVLEEAAEPPKLPLAEMAEAEFCLNSRLEGLAAEIEAEEE